MTTEITFSITCSTLAEAEKIASRLCGATAFSTGIKFEGAATGENTKAKVREHAAKLPGVHDAENSGWNAQEVGRVISGEPSQNEWNADSGPTAAFGDPSGQSHSTSANPVSPDQTQPDAELNLASDGKTLIPYDERIHTGGDNKVTKDGKWAKKRGVSADVVKQVEAELSGASHLEAGAGPDAEDTVSQSDQPPTYDDLSGLIAKAFRPGSHPVNLMEIFKRNGVNNIMEVPRDNTELVAKIYADVDAAMQGGA